jgi:predicted RecA/RadA family phage recombinase
MKNYVQQGHTITIVFPYAVTSGGGVQVGNIFGIASNTQILNDNGDIQLTGVFDIAKDTSTFADDSAVYWNNATKVCTSTSGGNMHIGQSVLATPSGVNALGGGSGDATVRVRLNASFPAASDQSGAIRLAHFLYNFAVDGGAVGAITPSISDSIPANALVQPANAVINSSTAVTSGGAATISVGTVAGSSATSVLAATAKTSFTLDAVLAGAATAFKMTAAGQLNITIAVATVTAGVIEGWVPYVLASNA